MAGITVTLLAFATVRYYYYLQTFVIAIAFIAAFFLIEPTLHGQKTEVSVQSILRIVRNTLWHHRKLSRYVMFSSIIGFASLSMAWFAQIFIYETGLPHRYFGIIWTGLNSMVALGSLSAHRIDSFLGNKRVLIYILIFMSGGYFLASQTITSYGLVFLLIFYFVRGSAHPVLKDRINANTQSDVRATVLSVRSLLIRILFALLGPLMGYITEQINLSFALILAGFVIFLPGLFLLILLLTSKNA
jgi:hypothetical protein